MNKQNTRALEAIAEYQGGGKDLLMMVADGLKRNEYTIDQALAVLELALKEKERSKTE